MNPVCSKCNKSMGVYRFVTVMETFCEPPVPYKLWSGTEYRCESCRAKVVVKADKPYAEHYQDKFNEKLSVLSGGNVVLDLELKAHIGITVYDVLKNREALNERREKEAK